MESAELNKKIQDAKQEVRIEIMAKLKQLINECDKDVEEIIKDLKKEETNNFQQTLETHQTLAKNIWINKVNKRAYNTILEEINDAYLNR
jgi:DNA integrity scanning protein DisA with diadenylate cyclase activity